MVFFLGTVRSNLQLEILKSKCPVAITNICVNKYTREYKIFAVYVLVGNIFRIPNRVENNTRKRIKLKSLFRSGCYKTCYFFKQNLKTRVR